MELKWIEDFLALSQYGSFAKAARGRHVTQPAFGRRIKALEDWLGVELINRHVYPTNLTPAGFKFLQHAHELKKHIEYARLETAKQSNQTKKEVTFCIQHALSEYVIHDVFQSVPFIFEQFIVHVQPNNLHDAIQAFLDRKYEFFIGMSFQQPNLYFPQKNIISANIGNDYLIPVVALNANAKPIFLDENGAKVPLLTYPSSAFWAQVLLQNDVLAQAKCQFYRVYENSLTHSLKSMVIAGYGVAWLPKTMVAKELKQGRLGIFSASIAPIKAQIKIYRFTDEAGLEHVDIIWKKLLSSSL